MKTFDPDGKLEQYKIKCSEEIKTNRQRRNLKNDITEKAQVAHRTGDYEASYDLFCHLLAAVETDPYTTNVSEMRATVTANIASALQFLGEDEKAKVRLPPLVTGSHAACCTPHAGALLRTHRPSARGRTCTSDHWLSLRRSPLAGSRGCTTGISPRSAWTTSAPG